MTIQSINATQAQDLIARGALLVDIRESDEYAREKIQSSRNFPLSKFQPETSIPSSGPIIFHCRTGTRTRNCAEVLQLAASSDAYILEDGLDGWKKAGLPVSRYRGQPIEIIRQVQIAAGSLVVAGALLGLLVHPAFYGLSAIVGAGLVFAGLSGTCAMANALRIMPWNRQSA